MAGFPSIGSLFRPTQQVAPIPGQPGQHTANPTPNGPPQGTPGSTMQQNNPAAGNPNPQATNQPEDNSSLAEFSKLWETDPNAKPPVDPWSQPILQSDPAKIQEAARKMNMLQGADPALVQKVMAGNDPQALMDLMQFVGQNTLAMSAQLATGMSERVGTTVKQRYDAGLEERFREFQMSNLSTDDPVLNHPAAQPMLKMVRSQIQAKNPKMPAEQVQAEAERFLRSFATSMNPGGNADPRQPKLDATNTPEQDWTSYLG